MLEVIMPFLCTNDLVILHLGRQWLRTVSYSACIKWTAIIANE